MLGPGGQSIVVLIIVCLGAAFGIGIQKIQPVHHRDDATKDVVKLIMGLMATMTALILSLLIASAHTFFDTQRGEIQQMGVNVLLMDQSLAGYGPESMPTRLKLKEDLGFMLNSMKPYHENGAANHATVAQTGTMTLLDVTHGLTPKTDAQRASLSAARSYATQIAEARLLMHEQATTPWPAALALTLLCWLALLFLFFGLFSPINATVVLSLLIGAVSVTAAMFLMLSMSHPYKGIMHLSDLPLRRAITQIGQ